ncbi:MAG: DMT family transporter [Pseudomonadota bacterium]|nr:DMT family transporter [Pseudomonadota bacterium]
MPSTKTPAELPPTNGATTLWLRLPGNFRGILWLSMGAFLFAVVDVFVKSLGGRFDPLQISFFRYGCGLIFLLPVFLRLGVSNLKTKRMPLHLLRMFLAFAAQLGIFITVIYMPLAEATAFMFSKPLFTTVVAVFLLHEVVVRQRWAATVVGFIGVLVLVRPGAEVFDSLALVAIGAALTFAIANVLIRKLSTTEPTGRILFYYHIGGVLLFVGPAAYFWTMPIGIEWLKLISIGGLTTLGIFGFMRAFAVGEANAVGPAENVRLIYAALFGYFLFAEIPSVWTGVGALIIVSSTYYIAQVEARKQS